MFMFKLSNANIRNIYSFVKVPIEKKMRNKLKLLKLAQYRNIFFLSAQNNFIFIVYLRIKKRT